MAFFTRTHGGSQPVFAIDQLNGTQTGTISADATVQIAGPKLDFFKILIKDVGASAIDLRDQMDTGGVVEVVLRTLTQLATLHFYQVEGDATGQISVAVYSTGAWAAADLEDAIQALGTVNSKDVSGSLVTNGGFKLA
jgi:hypothetical protein